MTALMIILSAAAAGALQTCLNAPPLALVVYTPMFYSVFSNKRIFGGRLGRLKSWHIFVFFSQLTSCSFILTVYRLMALPAVIGILVCIAVTILLALWLTLLVCLPVCFLERIRTGRIWDIFSFTALYCIGEWLCENVPLLSFPWSSAALSVVYWTQFIQTAGIFGAKGVTAVILIINGLIAYAALKRPSAAGSAACILSAALITTAVVSAGSLRISIMKKLSAEEGDTVNAVIAQDDIAGRDKDNISAMEAAQHYMKMLSADTLENADIVLLPETAVPKVFDSDSQEFSQLIELADESDVTVCSGAFYRSKGRTYNAVYALDRDADKSTPYLKQITVPFGESIPFAELFGMSTISANSSEKYSSPLKVKDYSIGCGICIESIYPSVFCRQAKQGCDFFIVPTNDSWFGKSFARYAHYRHSILRAVENGRYVLRSGNCGISAVISSWGEELTSLRTSDSGTISCPVRTQSRQTLYTKTGDPLFLSICVIWLAGQFFLASARRVDRMLRI